MEKVEVLIGGSYSTSFNDSMYGNKMRFDTILINYVKNRQNLNNKETKTDIINYLKINYSNWAMNIGHRISLFIDSLSIKSLEKGVRFYVFKDSDNGEMIMLKNEFKWMTA